MKRVKIIYRLIFLSLIGTIWISSYSQIAQCSQRLDRKGKVKIYYAQINPDKWKFYFGENQNDKGEIFASNADFVDLLKDNEPADRHFCEIVNYKEGFKEGEFQVFWEPTSDYKYRSLLMQGNYIHGKLDGVVKVYNGDQSNQVIQTITYKEGILNGEVVTPAGKALYEKGILKQAEINSKYYGKVSIDYVSPSFRIKQFDTDGKLIRNLSASSLWENSEWHLTLEGQSELYNNHGFVSDELIFKDNHCVTAKEFWEDKNGRPLGVYFVARYSNDKLNDTSWIYFPDGTISSLLIYKENVLYGYASTFYNTSYPQLVNSIEPGGDPYAKVVYQYFGIDKPLRYTIRDNSFLGEFSFSKLRAQFTEDKNYCPYNGYGLFMKVGPINESKVVIKGYSDIYQGENKIYRHRPIENNAFVTDEERRYYCNGMEFWNGKVIKDAIQSEVNKLIDTLAKEAKNVNQQMVKCLWCSKSIPLGESVSIHSTTGTVDCYETNGSKIGLTLATTPFCSMKCSEDYRKSACERNGYKSSK